MGRYLLALTVLLGLGFASGRGQKTDPAPPDGEEKGTYLGVLFSAVPEVLYEQLPSLPRGYGVVVTHVLPDSPAALADLRRHDILLQYDAEKIRDCDHFARLIRADKPQRKVKLVLLRGGRERTASVTLALGPVLKIAQAGRDAPHAREEVPKALAKPNGPGSVTVAAAPLGGGQLKVTIEYYQEGTGRLQAVNCTGTPEEIDGEVQKLPAKVQPLARVALERIRSRALNVQSNATTRPGPATDRR